MQKVRKLYIFILIFTGLLFLFFTNDFGLVDVQKTAIITGLAVDKEEDGYLVTADLAVPQASGQGKKAQSLQIGGEGKTISQCLTEIGNKTGWTPKLIYCHIIILGKETVKSDVFESLDVFLRNEYISDSCMIACTDGDAKDIFPVKSPVDDITSLALQKILSSGYSASGSCATTNLKDFAVGYYGETKSGFLPIIRISDQPSFKYGEETVQPASADSDGETAQTSSSGANKEQLFDLTKTALFYNGKMVEKLNADETFVLNLLRSKIRLGTFGVENEGVEYSLSLKHNKGRTSFKVENGIPKLKIKLSVRASIGGETVDVGIDKLSSSPIIPEEVKKSAEESLKTSYRSILDKCRKSRCDVFSVIDKLKRFENEYYEAYKGDVLDRLQCEFRIDIKSSKA